MTMYLGVMKSMRASVETDPDSVFRKSVNVEVYFGFHDKNRKWPYLTFRVTLIGITKCLICFTSLYFCLDHSCYVAQIFEKKHFCHH